MFNNISSYFVDKIDECNTCYKKKNLINCKVCSWSSCPNCWSIWIKKGHNTCPQCTTNDFSLVIYFLVFKINYNKYYNYYYNYYKNNIFNILFSFSKAYILGYLYCDINFLPQPDLICNLSYDLWILRVFINIYKGYMIQFMGIIAFILLAGIFLQICILCSMLINYRM